MSSLESWHVSSIGGADDEAVMILGADGRPVGLAYGPDAMPAALKIAAAPDLKRLIEEVLRAGNANTRALKAAIKKASPGWVRDARAALTKAGVKP